MLSKMKKKTINISINGQKFKIYDIRYNHQKKSRWAGIWNFYSRLGLKVSTSVVWLRNLVHTKKRGHKHQMTLRNSTLKVRVETKVNFTLLNSFNVHKDAIKHLIEDIINWAIAKAFLMFKNIYHISQP